MKTTIKQQLDAVNREVALRQRVYPRWVERGTTKQTDADYQIAVMKDVAETLRGLLPPKDTQAELL